MEIRDPVHGTLNLADEEIEILESRAFQRLRQIKQLGFAEFSFPGATHNRYIHSVGASHIASEIFDRIFKNYKFSSKSARRRFRQCLRLAVLLHDVGHGPLSHASEEVMPPLRDLKIDAYKNLRTEMGIKVSTSKNETSKKTNGSLSKKANNIKSKNDKLKSIKPLNENRQANHEDYTIKFITDSSLTQIIKKTFSDILPIHIACLVDKQLACPDDFFIDQKIDFRSLLSQIVSSELDADRLDYLERDAYFCGTNYGRIELEWILNNLTYHQVGNEMFLALNRRALYAFDDFLLARHHMNLMVYFHHKSIIYEEMLMNYLTDKSCTFRLPADIEKYLEFTDYSLYQHLSGQSNEWARRISERKIYRVLFEQHTTAENSGQRLKRMQKIIENEGIPVIYASSSIRLSKYHGGSSIEKNFPIFVVDHYDRLAVPYPIEQTTAIFQKYDEIRQIDRIYVPPEMHKRADKIIVSKKL